MKLPCELALVVSPALALPLTPRAATFPQLAGLTTASHDLSTSDARWPSKYFHESVYHSHYDGRFASAIQPPVARALHMRLLLRAYMAAMNRAGVRTWVMHGSLLAWWWNGAVFPWDSDLDFCVEEGGMAELGGWWNMTVHEFSAAELGVVDTSGTETGGQRERGRDGSKSTSGHGDGHASEEARLDTDEHTITKPHGLKKGVWEQLLTNGKKYLLEVNPHAWDSSTTDTQNKIDARWIDTTTGLFIDITTVHPVPSSATAKSTEKHLIFLDSTPSSSSSLSSSSSGDTHTSPAEMYTKDTHLYTTAALFPLRSARLEGTDVWVPYAYEQVLLEEYGPRALVETWYMGWRFERDTGDGSESGSASKSKSGSRSSRGKWVYAPEEGDRKNSGEKAGNRKGKGEGKIGNHPLGSESGGKAGPTPAEDNRGEVAYLPRPGRKGDVHVVPGSL